MGAVQTSRACTRRWRCYIKKAGKPGYANKWSGNGWEPGEGFDCDYKVRRLRIIPVVRRTGMSTTGVCA